jgi:hypothetical protein
MPSNKSEYQKEYMRNYIKNSTTVQCEICGSSFKKYKSYRHNQSNKHIKAKEKQDRILPDELKDE